MAYYLDTSALAKLVVAEAESAALRAWLREADRAPVASDSREILMGLFDKAKNKAQDAAGKGKEAAGDATNDDSTKMEGQADQAKASGKEKIEDVKDDFDN